MVHTFVRNKFPNATIAKNKNAWIKGHGIMSALFGGNDKDTKKEGNKKHKMGKHPCLTLLFDIKLSNASV